MEEPDKKITRVSLSSSNIIKNIFLTKPEANTVFSSKNRNKRANRDNNEENTKSPSLKRECVYEWCEQKEAQEIYPNQDDFNKFWVAYEDCKRRLLDSTNKNRSSRRRTIFKIKSSRKEARFMQKCLENKNFSTTTRRESPSQNFDYLPQNPCDSYYNNCDKNGTQRCISTGMDSFSCKCKFGYYGENCSSRKKDKNEVLEIFKPDTNEFFGDLSNNNDDFDYVNNYDNNNDYNTQSSNFKKSQIEVQTRINCQQDSDCNIGSCSNRGQCNCDGTGFTGRYCENDVNECDTGEHQCGLKIHCKNTFGSYHCECSTGYELNKQGQCVDINECNIVGKCDPNFARCINTQGSYDCQCTKTGFKSVMLGDRFQCENINECQDNNGGCDQACVDTYGSYACDCSNGYLLAEDDHTCSNINECLVSNGGCRDKCVDTPGSFSCECEKGWTLSADGVSCVDVNECTSGQSISCDLSVSKCINTEGGYECECKPNFLKDKRTGICHPTDQCKFDLHRCVAPAVCQTTTPGNYECVCPKGSNLSGKYRCYDINECLQDIDFLSVGPAVSTKTQTVKEFLRGSCIL